MNLPLLATLLFALGAAPAVLAAQAGALLPSPAVGAGADTLRLPGLRAPVALVRDRWGVVHIRAGNEHDLFFAQGWNAARDRLFQLEIWRRQATGTLAEVLGPRELARDRGARLLRFRGDMKRELRHYHPRGEAIVQAFADGVNARIAETERDPALLPVEFRLLGLRPGRWTPEVVVSRHNGLYENVQREVALLQAVRLIGAPAVERVLVFGPSEPRLAPAVDPGLIEDTVLAPYTASRAAIRFRPEDLAPAARADATALDRLAAALPLVTATAGAESDGSNNWVVAGRRSASGRPLLANDPHRTIAVPSLRYWVHLQAPGWNVIGGGEPATPGVSIGHNEHGAWGLTVFGLDREDLYVYETDPADPTRYRYRGGWERMRRERDTILVKGAAPSVVDFWFTRHGPVLFRDSVRHRAFALRAAWLEPGTAPYLASLRLGQARNWAEFRQASTYHLSPALNFVWADTSGTIGWQVAGIAPIRRNWSGLLPVPGDGRFEWGGYLPVLQLPHAVNPPEGFLATANENNIPTGYPHQNAVAVQWADPFRVARIREVLASGRNFTPADMAALQHDELALPTRALVPLLRPITPSDSLVSRARQLLLGWDGVLDARSAPAAVYVAWERRLATAVRDRMVPEPARRHIGGLPVSRLIELLRDPPAAWSPEPRAVRDSLLLSTLEEATREVVRRLGPDPAGWHYGDARFKHAAPRHVLSELVGPELRARLDPPVVPRGGYANTVNATGGGDAQNHGASLRIVVDVGAWDGALGTNAPGQSGDPDSPHYADLWRLWAEGRYFPVPFSARAVSAAAEATTMLLPR